MTSNSNISMLVIFGVFCVCCAVVSSASVPPKEEEVRELTNEGNTEIEGRSFVHHAMKRLAILLPAFMFKLGIMFTMMLVSMITSTKGLLVGTLLLALGVGHFIANRFSAAPTHAHISLPHVHAVHGGWPPAHHYVDRSDVGSAGSTGSMVGAIPAGYAQSQAYGAWKH